MYGLIVIVEIGIVCFAVFLLLNRVHAAQIVEIVRIEHRLSIWGVGEIGNNHFPPFLGFGRKVLSYRHKIHVIVDIKAVYVVGIACFKTHEFLPCGREILKLVFKNHTFIIKSFLYNIIGSLNLLLCGWNLFQIISHIVRVVLIIFFLFFFFIGVTGVIGAIGIIRAIGIIGGFLFIERERAFISPSPVVFQFSCSPFALEFGFSGVFSHCIVKIP